MNVYVTYYIVLLWRIIVQPTELHSKGDEIHASRGLVSPTRQRSELFLIFIGPCIVIHSHTTTNKMHLLSHIIYFCKALYMFRTVFPSITRSSKLRIQQRYMSNSCSYLLLAAGSSSCLTYNVAVYAVWSS